MMIIMKSHCPYWAIFYKSHGKWLCSSTYTYERSPSEEVLKAAKKHLRVKEIKLMEVTFVAHETKLELETAIHNANQGPLTLPEPEPERTYSSPMPERGSGVYTAPKDKVRQSW